MNSENRQALITVEGLEKIYLPQGGILRKKAKGTAAVKGVDFSICKGETLGLVGESGCGKTTLGKLLVGLEKPTSGSILYKGMDLAQVRPREMRLIRTDLQMVFQDPYSALNPRKHVYEILAHPMLYHGLADKTTVEAKVLELLDMVGLPKTAMGRYPHEFSGGQRQRIGIARALSLQPEFVVCDEPVSALDVSVQAQILNLLKSLQKDLGLTVLFIGHGLHVVHYISDRIAVMREGEIVEIGDATQVFSNPAHAYTKMLLDAVPIPDPRERR